MNNLFTKTGALIATFVLMVVAFIAMNFMNVEVNEILIFIAGAMVKTFLDSDTKEVKLPKVGPVKTSRDESSEAQIIKALS